MMWEGGNYWAEGRSNNPMASFHTMMHGIHVLLVDHDAESLINTAKNLEMCHYKVTFVELASAAIAMLLSEKAKFDVVMANINSPDLHGLKLLQHAVSMCIPVVLMSGDENAFVAMRALEDGAFLYIKKPPPMEFLRCLWQHVVREKTRMIRERELFVASNNLRSVRGIEFREAVHQRDENPNPSPNLYPYSNPNPNPHPRHHPHPHPHPNIMMMKNKGKHKSKSRGRHGDYDEEHDSDTPIMNHKGNVRRKMCTEWTQELHAKFMNAIEQLGEGRCFPKEILEMMNEPGLTRMQVASHLQKCRNDNWRSPEERKTTYQSIQQATSSANGSQPKPRRFGSKPIPSGTTFSGQIQTKTQERGQGSGTRSETETPNNVAKVGNWSTVTNNTPCHLGTNSSSNPRHGSDEYFNFLNLDSPTRNFSGGNQEPGINNPGRAQGGYRFNPAYNEVRKYGETSSQTKSRWSSDTSNLDSDHSETKVFKANK